MVDETVVLLMVVETVSYGGPIDSRWDGGSVDGRWDGGSIDGRWDEIVVLFIGYKTVVRMYRFHIVFCLYTPNSTVSSGLNSLTAVTLVDIIKPFRHWRARRSYSPNRQQQEGNSDNEEQDRRDTRITKALSECVSFKFRNYFKKWKNTCKKYACVLINDTCSRFVRWISQVFGRCSSDFFRPNYAKACSNTCQQRRNRPTLSTFITVAMRRVVARWHKPHSI